MRSRAGRAGELRRSSGLGARTSHNGRNNCHGRRSHLLYARHAAAAAAAAVGRINQPKNYKHSAALTRSSRQARSADIPCVA